MSARSVGSPPVITTESVSRRIFANTFSVPAVGNSWLKTSGSFCVQYLNSPIALVRHIKSHRIRRHNFRVRHSPPPPPIPKIKLKVFRHKQRLLRSPESTPPGSPRNAMAYPLLAAGVEPPFGVEPTDAAARGSSAANGTNPPRLDFFSCLYFHHFPAVHFKHASNRFNVQSANRKHVSFRPGRADAFSFHVRSCERVGSRSGSTLHHRVSFCGR